MNNYREIQPHGQEQYNDDMFLWLDTIKLCKLNWLNQFKRALDDDRFILTVL